MKSGLDALPLFILDDLLRKSIFPLLNRELFDLRKIYVVNLKTGCPKKCLMLVNLQLEIFLKSRVDFTRLGEVEV